MLLTIDFICFICLLIMIGVLIYFSRVAALTIQEKNKLEEEIEYLKDKREKVIISYDAAVLKYDVLEKEKEKITLQLNTQKQALDNSKDLSNEAFNSYIELLEESYDKIEKNYHQRIEELKNNLDTLKDEAINNYDELIEDLQKQWCEKVNNLKDLISTIELANEAIRRNEFDKRQKAFYQLEVSEDDLSDIKKLIELCNSFKNPRALRMILWSSYFQKETNNLCSRVKANNVTGIYKITNLLNNKTYIGQSKNISDRWKTHIKCGLGIDTPVTNSLYKAMMRDGVWNFTFEILEECPQERLNECESKWIAFYSSDEIGYNGNKGVNK